MIQATRKSVALAMAMAASIAGLLVDEDLWRKGSNAVVTEASARIGRPLSPVSFAGVARRTTRRAVVRGAVAPRYGVVRRYGVGVGVGYLGYAGVARRTTRRVVRRNVYGAGCAQVVNAYGQIVTRCY
jgi:hypothetical protein